MTLLRDQILVDPAASDWLKTALRAAMARDPVDAVKDAETLLKALIEKLDALMQSA
ncbi:hypothetical protein [Methylomonas lenta]|jgi:hypothetical protein|uniref:hypothetical protein n=1 Tax=Methylomonas lenta TaxID=980561 RepID=UPI000A9459D2|nr:hypothetical protein [Methylomonas lenta]